MHDELILVGGDKYLLKAPAIKALTEMLQRNSNYITERYHTLCAIRDEQRSKENKMERDAASATNTSTRKGRAGGSGGVGAAAGAMGGRRAETEENLRLGATAECRGLETYTAMFCRRCFKYDCHFHGIYHPQSRMKVRCFR